MRIIFLLLLFIILLHCPNFDEANQIDRLRNLTESYRSTSSAGSLYDSWVRSAARNVSSQVDGSMAADKIEKLPGQSDVDFDQYSGYVTVDSKNGRALFYYFVESPTNASSKPLVLWLNGVANVLFLESPAGVGFSYSNRTSDYGENGDKRTAEDSYTFLVNWLERFPQYKDRDFYITGESYAGHYVPQLALAIQQNNKINNATVINLRGVAIGNAYVDRTSNKIGVFEYYWTHALVSDETYALIQSVCNFTSQVESKACQDATRKAEFESGFIYRYDIYAPVCGLSISSSLSSMLGQDFDPCSENYVYTYLNSPDVQKALHADNRGPPLYWATCTGDVDAAVPITSTRRSIKLLGLPVKNRWMPWDDDSEIGGYVVEYEGLTLVTVRGAGHVVPSYQPKRALTMITSFLEGKPPPSYWK